MRGGGKEMRDLSRQVDQVTAVDGGGGARALMPSRSPSRAVEPAPGAADTVLSDARAHRAGAGDARVPRRQQAPRGCRRRHTPPPPRA